MKLNENFEVVTDNLYNFILIETYETKVKTIATKERYYPNLEVLYVDCLNLGLLKSDLKDLKAVLDKLDSIHADIIKQVNQLKENGGVLNEN